MVKKDTSRNHSKFWIGVSNHEEQFSLLSKVQILCGNGIQIWIFYEFLGTSPVLIKSWKIIKVLEITRSSSLRTSRRPQRHNQLVSCCMPVWDDLFPLIIQPNTAPKIQKPEQHWFSKPTKTGR
jgi:hypothetical protein